MAPTNFVVESWMYLAIDIVVVFGRVLARWRSRTRMAADDFLMVIAILLYTAETATAHYVGAYWTGLSNNSMSDEYRKNLSPDSHEFYIRTHGAQTQLFGWLVYTVLLWVLKLCWLFFYQRLGERVDNMTLKINVGFVLVGVTFFGTFLAILLKCQPVSQNWQIYPNPGNWCQPAVSKLQAVVLITTNLGSDFYIMSIPLPMVWSVRMSIGKKLTLISLFCGGLLTAVAGVLRCTFVLLDRPDGPQLAGEWSCRESFLAVLVSNVPVMYPILHRTFRRMREATYSRSRSRTDKEETGTKQSSGVYNMSRLSKINRKKPKHTHPLSLPADTFFSRYGSEEEIIGVDGETTKASADKGVIGVGAGTISEDNTVTREYSVQHRDKTVYSDMSR